MRWGASHVIVLIKGAETERLQEPLLCVMWNSDSFVSVFRFHHGGKKRAVFIWVGERREEPTAWAPLQWVFTWEEVHTYRSYLHLFLDAMTVWASDAGDLQLMFACCDRMVLYTVRTLESEWSRFCYAHTSFHGFNFSFFGVYYLRLYRKTGFLIILSNFMINLRLFSFLVK
jgi:hypothetical protein